MSKKTVTNNPLLILSSTSLAGWLTVQLSMPSPYMCIITCYVLTNIYAHEIYLKTTERVTGAVIAVAVLNFIISLGSDHIIVQQLLFLAAILSCFYLHFIRFKPYAMLIASVVLSFSMATELNDSGKAALALGENWTLDVLLGSTIAVLMNLLVKSWRDFGRVAPIDNMRFELELLFTSLLKKSRLRDTLAWDKNAFIKSIRIILIFVFIVVFNHFMGIKLLTVQALIGAVVVSVQLTFEHSHTKFWHRVLGATLGAILALMTLKLVQVWQWNIHWIWLIEIWLSFFLVLMWWQPHRKYFFFQVGLLIIMLITGTGGEHASSIEIAWQRALGNLEGGFISLVLIMLSDRWLDSKPKNEPKNNI